MEIFGIHTERHCKKCNSKQDHYTDLIKKADADFRLLEICMTCGTMFMTEFSAESLVKLLRFHFKNNSK